MQMPQEEVGHLEREGKGALRVQSKTCIVSGSGQGGEEEKPARATTLLAERPEEGKALSKGGKALPA
jgi:hypothetical protein